jgi:hypothetical protein
VEGFGIACYCIHDPKTGEIIMVESPAYYVLMVEVCLLSPEQLFKYARRRSLHVDKDSCVLTTPDIKSITIPYFLNNLPSFFLLAPIHVIANIAAAFKAVTDVVPLNMLDDTNCNLSHAQKTFLSWYHSLGHVGFQWLQELMSSYKYEGDNDLQEPIICATHQSMQTCPHPKCKSCLLANGA